MPKRKRKSQKFPTVSKSLKGNKNAVGNSGNTNPKSPFDAKKLDNITSLCMLGLTDKDLAKYLDVSDTTFSRWKIEHPELMDALLEGREKADAEIAKSLYHRAKGYSHDAEEIKVVAMGGNLGSTVERVKVKKHYPPDTKAASLWLRNRKSKFWKDRDSDDKPDDAPVVWNETKTYEK